MSSGRGTRRPGFTGKTTGIRSFSHLHIAVSRRRVRPAGGRPPLHLLAWWCGAEPPCFHEPARRRGPAFALRATARQANRFFRPATASAIEHASPSSHVPPLTMRLPATACVASLAWFVSAGRFRPDTDASRAMSTRNCTFHHYVVQPLGAREESSSMREADPDASRPCSYSGLPRRSA